jgi:tetratricopeptide (TPR) repeat protein
MNPRERRHQAEQSQMASADAKSSAGLCAVGFGHLEAGRHLDAQLCCQQALAADPNHADAMHLMGLLSLKASQANLGLEWLTRAIRLEPKPQYLAALGNALYGLGRLDDALKAFDVADRLQPNSAPTLQMRAVILFGQGRFEDALAAIARAHALDPKNAEICNNAGVFLRRLSRESEALPWFDRALAIRPDFLEVMDNKAFALCHLRRFDEAFAAYDQMMVIDPDHAGAKYNAGMLHLLTGNFEAGWAGREARHGVPGLGIKQLNFPQAIWRGEESVAGQTILVHTDEGLGDSIQYARYVPLLAARGAKVIMVVGDPLVPLLSELDGVAQCLPLSATSLPPFDMYIPMCSLPFAFRTTLATVPAATVPYLPAPTPERAAVWEARLPPPHDKMRVGLVWSGNPKHKNDHNRSLPLRTLLPLLDCAATFVSLQKDVRPDDKALLGSRREIVDLTDQLTDFRETAALVACLDLVISVDTSMAHLAGAMTKPTWIVLPHAPDFRWMLDRDDSPWYPTARLFRQPKPGDYETVISRMKTELAALMSAWPSAN